MSQVRLTRNGSVIKQVLVNLLLFTSLTVLPPATAWSCPFCPPSFRNTILQELEAAPVAVLAELVQGPQEDSSGALVTRYRVQTVLRGGDRAPAGCLIDLPMKIPSPLGSVHLLLADPKDAKIWRKPRGLSPVARQFLRQAALLPVADSEDKNDDQLRRLEFALHFLDSDDPDIAQAVFAEFSAVPYSTVKELAPLLHPEKLRAWIELEQGAIEDRRLLFTLLAICGRPEDADFIKEMLADCIERDELFELDGVIAAYLTLAGVKGLDQIDRELLEPSEVAPAIRRAAENALRFHAQHESILTKHRLILSARLLLDDPKSADYAIRDLTSWEDWESLDTVVALWKDHGKQCPWLRTPVRKYLEECPLPDARATLVIIP